LEELPSTDVEAGGWMSKLRSCFGYLQAVLNMPVACFRLLVSLECPSAYTVPVQARSRPWEMCLDPNKSRVYWLGCIAPGMYLSAKRLEAYHVKPSLACPPAWRACHLIICFCLRS
jgi:hypothetical protein